MAEFKLGRIRFIWKGSWAAATKYYTDDIVRNGGNTYVCIAGHTAPALFSTSQSTYWNKISDGQEWKSSWTTNTLYKVNDIVKYGGYLYIANAEHTSAATDTLGLEADQASWDLFAEGFDWKSAWTNSTRYKINDVVKYNGLVYLCTEEHTSAATDTLGLEADQSKWDLFSEGLQWTGTWATSTRYRKGDVARYGGTLYVANTGHTSAATDTLGLEADQSSWDYLHKGIEYKGNFTGATRYKVNDVVKQGGGTWICLTAHTSQTLLSDDAANWAEFVPGLEFEDSWNPTTDYQTGDIVTYGGYTYVSKTNHSESRPTDNPTDWDLFNTGFRFAGDWGDDSSSQDYLVGDVVRLGGYTYLCIEDHQNQMPPNATYWERLNSGTSWKGDWTDAAIYNIGDAVTYGNNSYIAVADHTSDETTAQNRPDQDTDGSEWNLLAGGAEITTLTTQGDLVYYGGAGPTRLPIGDVGQVLRVNSAGTAPEWGYFGAINNIFYVESTNGVDSPAPTYGSTTDRTWKTIRYATEQVERGALNPNARYMIDINKSFIQDETVEWVAAQITGGSGIWAGFTNDNIASCRRDMGQILDAFMWDLGHGGNVRTREAALTYFSGGSLIAAIADEDEQLVAAIQYMETVIDAVISNLAPAATYGSLTQVIDATKPEEANAQLLINNLADIITDAVTAGTDTGIPAQLKPQNTIYMKTGQFNEVLPIIVPENTALVGDELRSTRISPATGLVAGADVPYSLDALDRLKAIMDDVVTDPGNITKTTGNSLDPVTTHPVGGAAAGTAAEDLVQQIYDYIDYEINGATGDSTVPLMTGSNTPQTSTDYTYAVESIEANRAFIVAEILAYIADTYPAYSYDTAACSRDVNAYLDAIKYDLIYTGNYKSLLAGRYYVNAVQGSLTEDMFYMRNGSGLRNCTLTGMLGALGSANVYGTKRPTAGAYVSLDPSWGPAHTGAWITNKSPYVQNVTTFGTGCIGLKVDGDLHAGGNDSIVANDFTQILSDGIGAWVTNLGRVELVSVFSYYGHIGYLAENGGKIRATNGNSSYGEFGTVAEGVDSTETPITGTVDNRSNDAVIANVLTDGNNILTFEYTNAGVNYTGAGTTITTQGEGFGAAINAEQTVNGGVYEVRLLDVVGSEEGLFGGSGYINAQNTGQTGNTTSITISNTDIRTNAEYAGMAIWIISGTGAGQYGYINSYDSGSKIAQVYKASDGTAGWDHVTGATIETSLDDTTEYLIEPRLTFTAPPSGLYADTTKARARVVDDQIVEIRIWDPGSGYSSAPTMTVVDPNNVQVGTPAIDLPHLVRIGDGVLTQPTWTNRGTSYLTAEATVSGDGYADLYQPGANIRISGLTEIPQPGANITIDGISSKWFKLVTVRDLTGSGPYAATLQVSPDITITEAPEHNTDIEHRIRYSQVRLTGHDFLDIGTGNFANTNYPGIPLIDPDPTKETNDFGGGRVFYTSTDQDGNFRVGELFSIEQATGIATLNADAFNISGLQELQLGALSIGGSNATITEFSTDGTFVSNSDNIVPTQKAIRTYIQSQIGGGAGELNLNQITAGQIVVTSNTINTTTGNQINILAKTNFTGGVDGSPVAMNYFLLS